MTLIYRRCAGMDVHQKSISVCARIRIARDRFDTETAAFGTFTQDLEKMARWLRERRIRQVAMESTGVYWKPVWNVLEVISLILRCLRSVEFRRNRVRRFWKTPPVA